MLFSTPFFSASQMPHPAARLNGTVQGNFWANSQCNLRVSGGAMPNCLAGHGLITSARPTERHAAAAIANLHSLLQTSNLEQVRFRAVCGT